MAETSVPQWAMPTQKTKLVMYEAHMTGRVQPPTPRPSMTSLRSASAPIASTSRSKANAATHTGPGRSIIRRMSSLTERAVSGRGAPAAVGASALMPARSRVRAS